MSPLVTAGPLALDEHGSYWLLDSDLPGSVLARSLDHAAIPPLSAWLEQAFLAVFGKSEFAFRLPSALCYLGAIVVTWKLTSELADHSTAGLAALLLAWHPDLDEVRIARCYGLLMLLGALLLWCTIRWARRPGSILWPVLWGVLAAGMMWTHYVALPLIGMAWITLFVPPVDAPPDRIRIPAVLAAGVLSAVLCLPLAPAVLRLREWSPYLNYMPEGQAWWQTLGPLWWAAVPAGVIVALLLKPRRQPMSIEWRRMLQPALWTLIPLLFLVLMARGDMSSLANPRYRIPYAAGSACLIAVGLRTLNPRHIAAIAATLTVIVVAWSLAEARPWHLRRLGAPADIEWRDAARTVQADGVDGEPVFVQSGLVESYLVPVFVNDPVFLEYVGCRMSRFYLESRHPRIGLPYFYETPPELRSEFRKLMSPESATSDSFWIAAATDTDLNRASLDGLEQLARASGYEAALEARGSNMTLLRFHRRVETP
ncbi:MAG: glycosyltransferase family 39 protein [Planctomycetaceae bacterium]|nr:glycosyltransferase family 39 protein [Planctomycetaceae bacterium]